MFALQPILPYIFVQRGPEDPSSTAGLLKTLRPTKRFLLQMDGLEDYCHIMMIVDLPTPPQT